MRKSNQILNNFRPIDEKDENNRLPAVLPVHGWFKCVWKPSHLQSVTIRYQLIGFLVVNPPWGADFDLFTRSHEVCVHSHVHTEFLLSQSIKFLKRQYPRRSQTLRRDSRISVGDTVTYRVTAKAKMSNVTLRDYPKQCSRKPVSEESVYTPFFPLLSSFTFVWNVRYTMCIHCTYIAWLTKR